MRAALSRYYHFSHTETGGLTLRQARGYYLLIPSTERMFTGDEDYKQNFDLDDIYGEAEDLGLKPPKDMK